MSLLSSHTLFHFTPSLDNIEDMMLNGFKYGLVAERLVDSKIAYFVNEICFCNIPLSMITEHVDWYGRYAIGIRRDKARELGATPVYYVHSKSPQIPHTNSIHNLHWFRTNIDFTKYFKCDQGKQYKHSTNKYENKIFYDEKEWKILSGTVLVEKFTNNVDLYALKTQIASRPGMRIVDRVNFGVDDIEYIILDKYTDMPNFMTFLNAKFPTRINDILPKVLFYTQIKRDF